MPWKWMDKAELLINSAEYDSALVLLSQSQSTLKAEGPSQGYLRLLLLIGKAYLNKSQPDSSLSYYHQSLNYTQTFDADKDSLLGHVYHGLGTAYLRAGKMDSAIYFSNKALAIRKSFPGKDSILLAKSMGAYGAAMLRTNELRAGLSILDTTINLLIRNGHDESIELITAYSNRGVGFADLGMHKEQVQTLEKAYQLGKLRYAEDNPELQTITHNLSESYRRVGDFDKQIEYLHKSLELAIKVQDKDPIALAITYNSMAQFAGSKGDLETELEYMQEALSILKEAMGYEHMYVGIALYNLGNSYFKNGDMFQARNYTQKAQEVYQKALGKDHFYLADCYMLFGKTYYRDRQLDEALNFFQRAYELRKGKLGEDHMATLVSVQHLGLIFYDKKDYAKAREYYESFLKRLKKKFDNPNSPELGLPNSLLGQLSRAEKDYKISEILLLRSVEMLEGAQYPEVYSEDLRAVLGELGVTYLEWGKYSEAEETFTKALIKGDPIFAETQDYGLINTDKIRIKISSLKLLNQKAKAIAARIGQDPELWRKVLDTYKLASELSMKLRARFHEIESREVLARESINTYEGGVQAAYALYKHTGDRASLDELLFFFELKKAMGLYDILKESQIQHYAGLPEALLNKEKQLQLDIGFYEKKLFLTNQENDPELANTMQSKLFELRQEYLAFTRNLEDKYPRYFNLKYDFQVPTVAEIQRSLNGRDYALMEYFWTDSVLYAMLFKKSDVHVYKISVSQSILAQLQTYLVNWQKGNIIQEAYQPNDSAGWAYQANELYKTLLNEKDLQKIRHLTVIPDNILGYLPFEMLLTRQVSAKSNYSTWPFLLKDYTIQYNFSSGLWLNQRKENKNIKIADFLGVAPDYNNYNQSNMRGLEDIYVRKISELSALEGNQQEVEDIAGIVSGTALLADQATESAFKREASRFQILHLAMHTILDDNKPMLSGLVFSQAGDTLEDNLLYAYEIYNMKLASELAVLSACETGVGKMVKGEGMMSLARAFRYAGCENLVMTTWQAEDFSARELMHRFYQYMDQGFGKADALRQAKLDLMNETDRAHPYFWASFILLGDNDELEIHQVSWKQIGLMLLVVAFFIWIIWSLANLMLKRLRMDEKILRNKR